MSKFTQGNWVYDEFSAIVKTVSNNSRPICIVIEDGEDDYSEEDDTNGRLIAAAPEMYETLQSLVGVLSVHSYSQEEAVKICQLLARIDGKEAANE